MERTFMKEHRAHDAGMRAGGGAAAGVMVRAALNEGVLAGNVLAGDVLTGDVPVMAALAGPGGVCS
mgnify:CR=1 FL=1